MSNLSDVPEPLSPTPAKRRLPARLRGLWHSLRQSKFVRLLVGLAVLMVVFGILAFGLMRVLGPSEGFKAFTLPYIQDFTDVDVRRWYVNEGIWSIRQEMLAQAANLNKPAELYIPYKVTDEQPYHASTYLTFAKSTQQAGLNFNAQYPKMPDKQHQIYLERVPVDPKLAKAAKAAGQAAPPNMQLVAGYTDDKGKFVTQVTVPFYSDADAYRLDLYVLGNTYTVQVNGQTLIERRPLFYPNGLIGFHTLGPAKFDTVKITTAEAEPPGDQFYVSDFDQAPGGAGWVPFGGEWEVADAELVQANPAFENAGIGYEGSAFENYVVQSEFRHLVGVGGGLLFNMISPYQLNGAYVVRYSDQSDAIFWGYFDEQGAFTRQGYASVTPPGSELHQLSAYVGPDSYDVYLDDQMLARSIPLQNATIITESGRSGGHVGLITSQSSVAFQLVEVFPLFDNAPMPLRPLQSTPLDANGALSTTAIITPTLGSTAPATKPPPTATAKPTTKPTATPSATAPPPNSATQVPLAVQPPLTTSVRPAGSAVILPDNALTPTATLTGTVTRQATDATASTPTATPAPATDAVVAGTAAITVVDATSSAGPTATRPPATATPTPAVLSTPIVVSGGDAPWNSQMRGDMRAAGWRPISGKWRFSNDNLIQDDTNGQMAIVNTLNAYRNYNFEATFSHRDGNGAGILFNMPNPDKLNGAFMVRYSDRRPGGIFWGYFDDSGKFVGQGYANVDPPGDVTHRLRVVSEDSAYSVYLDDVLLVTGVPLKQNSGYVGLTTVMSAVDFSAAQVYSDRGAPPGAQTPVATQPLSPAGVYSGTFSAPNQRPLNGQWEIANGVYRQTAPNPADYVLNTGLYASNYTIEADMALPAQPEVGAGFVLQMPEQGRKAGAALVRLIKGGNGIFWGVYDETGTFRGQSSANLPTKPEGESVYHLVVDVNGGAATVSVDGEQITNKVVLPQPRGWIGLIAHGGSISFENLKITVKEPQ